MDFLSSKITLDGKHKQLIDLNKEHGLFETEFTITPRTLDLDKKYEIAVVSQSILDSDEISFKEITGIYKGTARRDDPDAEYENFFLVLKSSVKINELTIEVSIKPIAPPPKQQHKPVEESLEENHKDNEKIERYTKEDFWSKNKVKIIIALFVLIAGCFLMYYFWKKSQTPTTTATPMLPQLHYQFPAKPESIAPHITTTEKLFNPFKKQMQRSPPSIASSKFSKSPGSDSSHSFVFEE